MKLYVWEPKSHGPCVYTVVAESFDAAIASVCEYIEKQNYSWRMWCSPELWLVDVGEYKLTVCDVNEVHTRGTD